MGKSFRLLTFLYGWIQWERIVRGMHLEEPMNNRCSLCGLYGCSHIRTRQPGKLERKDGETIVSLGQRVGEDTMDDLSGVVIDKEEKRTPTIPMGPLGSDPPHTRVLIPPSAAVPNISVGPVNRELQKVDLQKDWVNCSLCQGKVYIPYLDQHLKVHTHNYEPNTITTTSTSIVRVPVDTFTAGTSSSSSASSTPSSTSSSKPTLSKQESYKFRPLEQVCFASSVSKNNRFSDFTVIFWEKERVGIHTTSYAGGSTSNTTKEWERFSIHIVYDSLEDYYMLSSKLLKRSGYSSWDSEDTIPDRICFQHELFNEIKRALLFFRISPKAAYKHFRKLMSSDFLIEKDDNNKAFVCQTKNCVELNERLKKSCISNTSYNESWC